MQRLQQQMNRPSRLQSKEKSSSKPKKRQTTPIKYHLRGTSAIGMKRKQAAGIKKPLTISNPQGQEKCKPETVPEHQGEPAEGDLEAPPQKFVQVEQPPDRGNFEVGSEGSGTTISEPLGVFRPINSKPSFEFKVKYAQIPVQVKVDNDGQRGIVEVFIPPKFLEILTYCSKDEVQIDGFPYKVKVNLPVELYEVKYCFLEELDLSKNMSYEHYVQGDQQRLRVDGNNSILPGNLSENTERERIVFKKNVSQPLEILGDEAVEEEESEIREADMTEEQNPPSRINENANLENEDVVDQTSSPRNSDV